MGNSCCCQVISESTIGIVEYLGKYEKTIDPGFHFINCFCESVTHRVDLKISTFNMNVETLTKDNINVKIKVGVQYKVNHEEIKPIMSRPIKAVNKNIKNNSDYNYNHDHHDEKLNLLDYANHFSKYDSISTNMNISNNNSKSDDYITNHNSVYMATYKTRNAIHQMQQFIESYFRGISCDYNMNELFASKNKYSDDLTMILNHEMHQYGYIIHKALIVDIDPPEGVKKALNSVSEAVNAKKALIYKAEGEKEAKILRAQADCEVRRLEGEGLAKQRQALVEGLKHSVSDVADGLNMDPRELTSTIITMQYIDMLDRLGTHTNNTFILSPNASGGSDIENQVRNALLSTKSANSVNHKSNNNALENNSDNK